MAVTPYASSHVNFDINMPCLNKNLLSSQDREEQSLSGQDSESDRSTIRVSQAPCIRHWL